MKAAIYSMGEDMQCHTSLCLGIGEVLASDRRPNKSPVQLDLFLPAWIKDEDCNPKEVGIPTKEEGRYGGMLRLQTRAATQEEGRARKKLRLTKEQSTILEESFQVHSTLNQNQKQHLAERLNLRPRQVEVWFQNRRARTKLKQTEVDCAFLKKCCESLSDENRRLKRELQELKAAKTSSPVYVELPKATARRMCPSCESIALDHDEEIGSPEQSQQALRRQ